jgi:diacylglycerol kinase family enzyme
MSERMQHLEGAVCIINPSAAKRKWLRRKRLKDFLDKNLPGQKFDNLSDKETTIALVARLAPLHHIIIALGGDGTIADVMQGIRQAGRESDVVLGIVPLGSGNAFRKSLAIPKNVQKAIEVLDQGRPAAINLMDIEGYISGFSSIGGTALVTGAKLRQRIKGLWGHVLSGASLLNLPLWEIEAHLEDGLDDRGQVFERKTLKLKVLDVVVAKSNYFGYSFLIAPHATLDDDYLDITFFEMSAVRYAMLLPLTYFGLTQRRLKHFKAKRLVLEGKDLPVQYHGEFLGIRDRVEVRAVPRAVRVICPPRPQRTSRIE